MSKIISLNVFLEYNSFRYIISGNDNKGYKGRADRIMRFSYVKAEAATFDSCRILMENRIVAYLANQSGFTYEIPYRRLYNEKGEWIASERTISLPVINPDSIAGQI